MTFDLGDLKKEYSVYAEKYRLPGFKTVNSDFEIEKIEKKSDTFLRSVRKTMMEKVVNTLGFLEAMYNPVNAPRMYVPFISSITSADKSEIDKYYKVLAGIVLTSLDLEMGYEEKREAELIKRIIKDWQEVKLGMKKLIKKMEKPGDSVKKEKNYFG